MDPSKPTDGEIDQSTSIPRSRTGSEEALVGEVIDKGVPLQRPVIDAEPKDPPKRIGKLRTAFIVMLAVAGLVCTGGLVVGYIWYHNATEPNRSTPVTSTLGYVNAMFADRDDFEAARYTCADPESITAIHDLRQFVEGQEHKSKLHIAVQAEGLQQSINGKNATVESQLRITVVEDPRQKDVQQWKFTLVDRSGWKVCDAVRTD